MKTESLKIVPAFIVIFLFLVLIPGVIWGAEGTFVWFPLMTEYLLGHETYQNSLVFSGQNLMGAYGELPLWNLFKLIGLSVKNSLNLTFFIWSLLSYSLVEVILKGMKGVEEELSLWDRLAILLFVCLSPIVFNRVYAGHLALVFGLLPLLVSLAFLFSQSKLVLFLGFVSLWSSFSLQTYPIVIYLIFYLPLMVFFFKEYATLPFKRYVIVLVTVTLVAFACSYPSFQAMYHHVLSNSTGRDLSENIVYDYLTSELFDVFNLIFSSNNFFTMKRGAGVFHELNYPLIPWLIYLCFKVKSRALKIVTVLTSLSLFFFAMGVAPFNLLAELPLIKSLRVPQRTLMFMAFFIPVWGWSLSKVSLRGKDFLLLLTVLIAGFIVPYVEVALLLYLGVFGLVKNFGKTPVLRSFELTPNRMVSLLLGVSILLSPYKVKTIIQSNEIFFKARAALKPLTEKFTLSERRKYSFHFNTKNPFFINAAAHSLGFRTYEGYGHPPKKYRDKVTALTGFKYPKVTNDFIFPYDEEMRQKAIKGFSVDYQIQFDSRGIAIVDQLKKDVRK